MTDSLIAIVVAGIVSGWVMGTCAAAWGVLSVPLLILAGVEPSDAIFSSLAVSVFLSLFGGLTHWRYDRSRMALFAPLLFGGVGGAFLGSLLGPTLPTSTLRLFIGLTTLSVGLLMLLRQNGVGPQDVTRREAVEWRERRAIVVGVGAIAGLLAGAFGAGWGTVSVPLLVWAGMPPHTVVGSSLMARCVVAAAAAGSHALQAGSIPLMVFFPLLLAGISGVYLGARVSNGLSPSRMEQFIGGVVIAVGTVTVARHLW